ncbi:TetR/AcrR family transcriptional regulator [Priestia flexa]|uniref:TetR/AcrR family transcriptional regulator n=1 Tax=Priestia flexa TaxID=86664 RepID=UPI0032F04EC0
MSPRAGINLSTILQASLSLITEEGHDNLTLGRLAKSLNIKTPSLYNHIANLADLRQRLAIYGLQQLYKVMAEAAIGQSGERAILSLSFAYVNFARQSPGLYEAMFRVSNPDDPELRTHQEAVVQIVTKSMDAYSIDKVTKIHLVRGLRSLLHGFTFIEQQRGFQLDLDANTSLTVMIQTFINGFSNIK